MAARKTAPNAKPRTGLAAAPAAASATTTTAQDTGASGGDAHQGGQTSLQQAQGAGGGDQTSATDALQVNQAAASDLAVAAAQATATAPDPEAEREYVVGTVPIRHSGRLFEVSHSIYLTDTQAKRLGGLVTLIPY